MGDKRGIALAETIMLLPLFLLIVFGLLQMGQLGTALVVVNYAASSIARQAVRDNQTGSGQYEANLDRLMTAGMKNGKVATSLSEESMARNIHVDACAEIDAFPFIGHFLGSTLAAGLGSGSSSSCSSLGVLAFSNAPPGRFVVHGQANARMNYR